MPVWGVLCYHTHSCMYLQTRLVNQLSNTSLFVLYTLCVTFHVPILDGKRLKHLAGPDIIDAADAARCTTIFGRTMLGPLPFFGARR